MKEESLLNFIDGISHKVHFNSSEKMKEVKKESVQCVVTSPPYWDLKNYNVDGQIGYKETYEELQNKGKSQKQLSKEFVRQWLIEKNFQGLESQTLPYMDDDVVNNVSNRYIELYEKITNESFQKGNIENISLRIEENLKKVLI